MNDELPPPLRLALAYAPAAARRAWATLLALDARLAGVVRAGREPILAQIKLAWWRDRLNEPAANWPTGEPLLAELATWGEALPGLAGLVDGWEALLAEPPLLSGAITTFADGRAAAITALAGHLGHNGNAAAPMARGWALVDLAAHLSDSEERAAANDAAMGHDWRAARLPRALRPLAVLHSLAAHEIAGKGGAGALLAAIRVGIFGR